MAVYLSKEWREAVGNARRGVPSLNFRDKELWKARLREAKRADKNPNWRGGITPENKSARMCAAYRNWRKAVFERDNFACVVCGDATGGNLEADHIKPFAGFPELRYEVANGRTLCIPCHRKTDTWGR